MSVVDICVNKNKTFLFQKDAQLMKKKNFIHIFISFFFFNKGRCSQLDYISYISLSKRENKYTKDRGGT